MSLENNFPVWPAGSVAQTAVPGLFSNSPFGEHWNQTLVLDIENQNWEQYQNQSLLIYRLATSSDGAALINLYQDEANIRQQEGSFYDKKADIFIYYETDDRYNSFGSVCFVQMNKIVRGLFISKFGKAWINTISEQIVEDYPSKKLSAKKISEAIEFEIETGNSMTTILEKIGCRALKWLAEKTRENKFSEKEWDADRKDYSPFFSSVLILDDLVKGWNSFQKGFYSAMNTWRSVGFWCRKNLGDFGDFINECITGLINFFTEIVEAINSVIQFIAKVMEAIKIVWAFICGLLNAIVDMIAGIFDLIAFILSLTEKDKRQHAREIIENFLEACRTHPFSILKSIIEYIDKRYNGTNQYQHAYNAGEDVLNLILLAESAAGIVKFARDIPKAFSEMKAWLNNLGSKSLKSGGAVSEDFIALSKRIENLLKNNTVVQNSANLDELYKAAKIADNELKILTEKFADQTGGEAGFRPRNSDNKGLKERETALEKITADYNGDASKILDISGSKVIYETIDDLYKALKRFADNFDILKFKDRIQNPPPSGYRDILMNVRMQNGHIVEFRLHLKIMDEAAIEGHKIYRRRKALEAISAERNLTIKEKELIEDLLTKEKKIYNNAWDEITKTKN